MLINTVTPSEFPVEYQEVEYIQNSGTQWIDTELYIKDGYRIVTDITIVTASTCNIGGYLGYQNGQYYRLYTGGNPNGTLRYGFMNYYSENIGSYSTGTKYNWDVSLVSGNMFFKVDGTSKASSSSTYSTTLTGKLNVFSDCENQIYGGAKIYSFKVYNSSGTLVRDLMPCYRKSDNVIGMLDKVNDVFYENAGTGTFTKGPDVN